MRAAPVPFRIAVVTAALCALPAWVTGDALGGRQQQRQQQQQQQQEQQPAVQLPVAGRPPALPDLRIASLELSPEIPRDRNRMSISVLVHNDSSVVVAGRVGIQVVHDRGAPQPLPVHHEILYLGPDELAEVTFDLFDIDIDASPYRFFAKVDVFDVIEEADEFNNTAWERVQVCGSPEFGERPDGFDNDCDGMVDEGLGLAADPEIALQMLRRLQQQALADSVPLVYALSRLAAPFATETAVRLSGPSGLYWGLATSRAGRRARNSETVRQAEISTSLQRRNRRNVLALVDWNGGELENGDLISLRVADGRWIVVGGRRVPSVVPRSDFFEPSRLFTIVLVEEETVDSALVLALAAGRGRFVELSPNDGVLRAGARQVGGTTTFVLTFVETGTEPGELR